MQPGLEIAVVGAGPVGLALALLAARRLPEARIALFDARSLDRDVAADPRTLALSLGSVQLLERLGAWRPDVAEPIRRVHVSQAPAGITLGGLLGHEAAAVTLDAGELGVAQLGAVLAYGALLAPLQAAWLRAAAAEPQRLATRFGTPVAALKALPDGVEVDAGIAERFDLAVVAEGGVFAEQSRKALVADYGQTAWVGSATLAAPMAGTAFERFTPDGPVALLPLPAAADGAARAALVWCVPTAADPVAPLSAPQRLALLNSRLPAEAGTVTALSPLKSFALGLNAERSLVQGRTVRIGNAAQTLHPVAGQGLNLGLRDAHALVDALQRGPGVDAALARAAFGRAPDRWSLIVATDFLARSFTWRLPGAAALRSLGLAALQALPPAKAALARRMMFGWR
ncbi:MAG: FAD-dependent monooxygenase [Betaproteobacteria bacterium]